MLKFIGIAIGMLAANLALHLTNDWRLASLVVVGGIGGIFYGHER